MLRTVLDRGPIARSTIARVTGLSPATVTTASAQLVERGLLRGRDPAERGDDPRGAGRPTRRRIRPDRRRFRGRRLDRLGIGCGA
ncbi:MULTISPECIES: MarR family transcriptional regulator [Rhodococcus]|uniref:MarR family transcriptional regulator n=1 Tax=Rhodococcus TaxID=1827 RepID=UPI001ED8D70B|nr:MULTISPECIES: MarR family transcriptional regulator [Rhodococcus]